MTEGNGKTAKFTPILTTAHSEFFAVRPNRYGESSFPASLGEHAMTAIDPRGRFAMACIEKWGMVAAIDGGEDTSGRHKLALQKPEDVVARAFDIAERAYVELEKRGWLATLPTMAEMVEKVKERENDNN